jgi:hypothetical protein
MTRLEAQGFAIRGKRIIMLAARRQRTPEVVMRDRIPRPRRNDVSKRALGVLVATELHQREAEPASSLMEIRAEA